MTLADASVETEPREAIVVVGAREVKTSQNTKLCRQNAELVFVFSRLKKLEPPPSVRGTERGRALRAIEEGTKSQERGGGGRRMRSEGLSGKPHPD